MKTKTKVEQKGEYPSPNCHCHIHDVYGFVPEADCPEHDTNQFIDFVNKLLEATEERVRGENG